jgi:hypothetical protein
MVMCVVAGCFQPRKEGSFYCIIHKCEVENCRRKRTDKDSFCLNHHCLMCFRGGDFFPTFYCASCEVDK